MSVLQILLDGKEFEPLEYKGIEIELNYEDSDEVAVSVGLYKLTWVNSAADYLNSKLDEGLTGGPGIYYGVPLQMFLQGQIIFDGYVDLSSDAQFSCEKVIAKVREKKKLDWMEKTADSFGFDFLYDQGIITDSDFVKIPYIISDSPDYKQAGLFFLYGFVMVKELIGLVKEVIFVLSDIAGYFSSIAGVLKLIFLIGYIIIIVTALIKLTTQMIEELISFIRYHYGMMVKLHFEKACQYLGLTFRSSIFDQSVKTNNELSSGLWEKLCLMPKKFKRGFRKNESTDQRGYYSGTFGQFIRDMSAVFNAKFIIKDGYFLFERHDFGTSTASWKIPDVRRDFNGTNADEIVSNYLIEFEIDSLDQNTITRYAGTNAKNYITPKVSEPNLENLITGSYQPPINFARGYRKNELTRVEEALKSFLSVIDTLLTPIYAAIDAVFSVVTGIVKTVNAIISAINAIIPGKSNDIKKLNVPTLSSNKNSLSQTIGNRIGMLSLSGDATEKDKIFLVEGSGWDVRITQDNETKLTASNLWYWYHYISSMVPSTNKPNGNQCYTYEIPSIPFCIEDYNQVRGFNNLNQGETNIISPSGNPAKLLSLKWNIYNNKASIKYKEEKLYTDNLQETLLSDNGE